MLFDDFGWLKIIDLRDSLIGRAEAFGVPQVDGSIPSPAATIRL